VASLKRDKSGITMEHPLFYYILVIKWKIDNCLRILMGNIPQYRKVVGPEVPSITKISKAQDAKF